MSDFPKITIPSWGKKALIFVAGVIPLSAISIYSVSQAFAPPEIKAEPAIKCDSNWLIRESEGDDAETDTGDRRDYDREQTRLFLTNQDPSLCSPGIIPQTIDNAAIEMIGQASFQVNLPKHSCFGKSVRTCLNNRYEDVKKRLEQTKTPLDQLKVAGELQALNRAIMAVNGEVNLQSNGQVKNQLGLLINRMKDGDSFAFSSTVEGIATDTVNQQKAEAEALKDAENGFSLEPKQESTPQPKADTKTNTKTKQ